MRRLILAIIGLMATGAALGLVGLSVHLPKDGYYNIATPTLGGLQIWTDENIQGQWRVQRNSLTGHCRLIDDDGFRRFWGKAASCETALAGIPAKERQNPKHLVLMIHGLGGYPGTFSEMLRSLDQSGVDAVHWNYASTQFSINEHAQQLNDLLDAMTTVESVSFVTHSMGGLVLRRALSDHAAAWRQSISLGGAVIIAAPNDGAMLADRVLKTLPDRSMKVGSVSDLRPSAVEDIPQLDIPVCNIVAVLAGEGNPMIDGPDDGLVGLGETWLGSDKPDLLVRANHFDVNDSPEVIDYTMECIKKWMPDG